MIDIRQIGRKREINAMPFTLVFEGDLKQFHLNPFKVDTPYGKPYAVAVGDALKERDEIEEELEKLKRAAP